jgi:FkbM family methyltransferase
VEPPMQVVKELARAIWLSLLFWHKIGAVPAITTVFRSLFGRADRPFRVHLGEWGHVYLRPRTSDMFVLRQIFVDMEYDITRFPQFKDLWARYQRLLRQDIKPLILDCGANIGLSTIYWARLFPEAAICAVEPSDDNLRMLLRNTRAISGVTVEQAALWRTDRELRFRNPGVDGWALAVEESAGGSPRSSVRGVSPSVLVAEQLAKLRRGALFLVKMDIEGGERDLFDDATLAQDAACLIVELHDWLYPNQHTSRSFLRFLAHSDREIAVCGENIVVFPRQAALDSAAA